MRENAGYDPYCAEIMQFIEDNYNDYVVSMPKHVIIEEGITSVSEKAFYKCESLETVELSDTVTKIGKQAFSDCTNLKSFDLKNVKEIESAAFYNTTFDTIDITNVEKLGGSVFGGSSISEISLPEGITVIEGLFINCSKLKEIIIPNSVTQIDDWSFKGCTSLESIRIPNSVVSIGNSAFNSCSNLATIYIPDSVTSIDRAAFNYINSDATIYCETQRVANMLKAGTNYMPGSVNVVVDESMFS